MKKTSELSGFVKNIEKDYVHCKLENGVSVDLPKPYFVWDVKVGEAIIVSYDEKDEGYLKPLIKKDPTAPYNKELANTIDEIVNSIVNEGDDNEN